MKKDVIIACDFSSKEELYAFLKLFPDKKPFLKIGMELYYAEGPEIVKKAKELGHRVFLDLKLHDIPTTVKKSMAVLSSLGVDMVNVHAAGTVPMMEAAREGLGDKSLLIAVTQLTSTTEEVMRRDLLIERPMEETVLHYASRAKAAGLDGVVCSPLEAAAVHDTCGKSFLTVTPGIRFADGDVGDQARVMTPLKAGKAGSDFIVVGRPITKATDPAEAYERCVNDFCK